MSEKEKLTWEQTRYRICIRKIGGKWEPRDKTFDSPDLLLKKIKPYDKERYKVRKEVTTFSWVERDKGEIK